MYFIFFRNTFLASKAYSPTTITRKKNSEYNYNEPKEKKLLVIYIDGLSSFISEESNVLQHLMPETYKFFRKSKVYENYYATAEWTLPNYASLMTGALQNSHGFIYSAKKQGKWNDKPNHALIHEYLAGAGLTTNVISAVPYINPNFKFHLGTENFYFSRNLNSTGILELFHHLESRCKNHSVTWLHFMDIHHRLRDSKEMNNEQNNWLVDALINSYRFSRKDAINFISRALSLDADLAKLFKMESTNKYENIILVSDHGSTRLNADWGKCLDDARAKTTLMVKCKNQKKTIYIKDLTTHLSFI